MTILYFQAINAISLIISPENDKNIDIIINSMVLRAHPEIGTSGIAPSALSFQLSARTMKNLGINLNAER
jgi:hypothetical protein